MMAPGQPWIIGLLLGGIMFIAFNDRFTKGVRRKAVARFGTALFALGIGLIAPAVSDDNAATAAYISSIVSLFVGGVLIAFAHIKDR
jgi:uncharacterized membrane protein YqgA involved in biofilm formation